jgi:hypothetical protein
MGGQVWKPPVDQKIIDEQKAAKERDAQAWRTQQLFGSVIGGGGSNRGLDWSSMPKMFVWK